MAGQDSGGRDQDEFRSRRDFFTDLGKWSTIVVSGILMGSGAQSLTHADEVDGSGPGTAAQRLAYNTGTDAPKASDLTQPGKTPGAASFCAEKPVPDRSKVKRPAKKPGAAGFCAEKPVPDRSKMKRPIRRRSK